VSGVEDLAVPVAEDRARLAVHLVRLHDAADPGERREDAASTRDTRSAPKMPLAHCGALRL
jgi:hypothetical protein